MLSLIYVSRPLVDPGARAKALDDIQAVSIARNTDLDITGLLISTSDYFAQILEGPESGVDAVMARIAVDPRHHEVRIIRRSPVSGRRFPHWRMARFDGESFGAFRVNPLLADCHMRGDADAIARFDRLVGLMAVAGRLS